jgi:hypothetical protein
VRSSTRYGVSAPTSTRTVEWTHRWTVRGHKRHFAKGPIFDNHPERRRVSEKRGEHMVVWCPPFIKGPRDKPLRLKARRVARSPEDPSAEA